MNKESNEQQIVVEDEFCEEISKLSEESLEGVTGGDVGTKLLQPMFSGAIRGLRDANISPGTQDAMRDVVRGGSHLAHNVRNLYRNRRGGGPTG